MIRKAIEGHEERLEDGEEHGMKSRRYTVVCVMRSTCMISNVHLGGGEGGPA